MKKNHVKPWSTYDIRTFTKKQQARNLVRFIELLPTLPIARLEDFKRRDRPDPRLLPESTPLCIADHCWRIYSAGTRTALGILEYDCCWHGNSRQVEGRRRRRD